MDQYDKYFQTLSKKVCSGGSYGEYGIEIRVFAKDLDIDKLCRAGEINDAMDAVEMAMMTLVVSNNEKAQLRRKTEKEDILKLFENVGSIFVEEIPNGYCSDWCCKHLPWFVVTTQVGKIKIGWRKRVLNIDWSETVGTKGAEELFADINVTKGEKYIHAWSYELAKAYIEKIIQL